ncbi:DUF1515 domain-containing protein [Mesorhizobium sp. M0189]|uniref:DUF1515 family protein n=1 Tax=Mesorhizobium sp. M0189 TaxID=2956909 RepID=UPI00333A7CC6
MTNLDDISEAIGGLRAEVKNLGQMLARSEDAAFENNRRADQHRAAIHRRVDVLVDQFGAMSSEVKVMKDTVADSKKVTDEVKMWKQRGIGALFVSGIAGSAVGGTVAGLAVYYFDTIMRLIRAQ